MHFRHQKGSSLTSGSRKVSRGVLLFVSIAAFAAGIYLLILVLTPNIPFLFPVQEISAKQLPKPAENRVYIPKIGVNVPLLTGGAEALEKGAWHRFPERGDPIEGGNFIVSAHRFSLAATPGQTRQKSPFYHIDKLSVGDQIIFDFNGRRYGYEITTHEEVKPAQVEIEAQISSSQPARLTLYTCTLKGETDGREVFFAKPLGEVDENGNVARTD